MRLRKCLQNHMKTIQFAYSRCFPEIYSLIGKRGINLKSEFLLIFKAWKESQPETEKELWERLDTLSKNFKAMKELKKQSKSKNNLVV